MSAEECGRELSPLKALCYLDDIAHGRKMKYDPHELKLLIEAALKNYEKLTSKPVILYGRTHGSAQAFIDKICKNYKEVKIINLEDEKKLKALEIIKEKVDDMEWLRNAITMDFSLDRYNDVVECTHGECLTKEEYDLLKEVLL